jgi:hypothetical protein
MRFPARQDQSAFLSGAAFLQHIFPVNVYTFVTDVNRASGMKKTVLAALTLTTGRFAGSQGTAASCSGI